MAYRAWPAAALTGAALAAACVVVGDHVVQTRDGCLGSAGWFTATPVSAPMDPVAAGVDAKIVPYKIGPKGSAADGPAAAGAGYEQISGCLDVDRIEVPAQSPAPDGRA